MIYLSAMNQPEVSGDNAIKILKVFNLDISKTT